MLGFETATSAVSSVFARRRTGRQSPLEPKRENRIRSEVASGWPVSGSVSSSHRRWCSSGRAAIDGELHPEEVTGALDRRLELAVLLTHVRLLVGDEALRGEEALRERKAVRVPRRVLELHEVERIESGHGAKRRPLGIVRGVEAKLDLVLPRLVEAAESDLELGVAQSRGLFEAQRGRPGSPKSA